MITEQASGRTVESIIPAELRAIPRWVVWRAAPCLDGGKPRKMPIDPKTGGAASSTDAATWADFDTAREAAERDKSIAGLGIILTGDDDLFCIDLDDAVDADGEVSAGARRIIESLNSWTEVSQSGRGLHIFARGTKPGWAGCKSAGVEIYDARRYIALTGSRLPGAPETIEHRQDELDALCGELWPDRAARAADRPVKPRQTNNGDGVIARWNRERPLREVLQRFGYTPCGPNRFARPGRSTPSVTIFGDGEAERSFHHSENDALRDPDHTHDSFGVYCQLAHGGDVREAVRAAAEELGIDATARPGVSSNARRGPNDGPAADVDSTLTDCGNADRFVTRHGNHFRYVHEWKRWLRWDGQRWAPDARGRAVIAMKEVARGIHGEAVAVEGTKVQDEISAWAKRSQQKERINAALELARPDLAACPDELDADPYLLNVTNGTIDLRTGELRPHRPGDFITKLAPVDYEPAADPPRFREFVNEVFDNRPELIAYVQTLLGHCLSGIITEQILPVFHGTGANGKSTLLETVLHCMGDYADFAPPGLLILRRRDEHPTEIAGLAGKRLIIAAESDKGGRLRAELVKQLTGESELTARYMRGDFFTFARTFKVVLQTNHRPRVDEDTEAIWRRLRLIPFDVTIPKENRNPHLLDQLKAESTGILAWLVAGAVAWHRGGLQEPPEVQAATAEYRAESDRIAPFIEECCELDPDAHIPARELRAVYTEWAKSAGERPLNRGDFAEALRRHKCEDDRIHAGRIWRGIRLIRSGSDRPGWRAEA